MRLSEFPTYAPLGQYNMPVAMRTNVSGNMEAPATVFWNVKKATLSSSPVMKARGAGRGRASVTLLSPSAPARTSPV